MALYDGDSHNYDTYESYDENDENLSDAGSVGNLYEDHEINDEMVIGPVEIWKPVTIKFPAPKPKYKEPVKKTEVTEEKKCKICETEDIKHYTCAECERIIFARFGIITHLRNHRRPQNICKICQKQFQYKFQLNKHMLKHSNNRPFACNLCDKRYKRGSSLIAHKYTHGNQIPYKCKHCEKSFTTKGHLQAHSRLHTGEKPYTCDICSKTFTQQTSLNNHVLIHKGIKPFNCEHCKERFRQVSNLKKHLETKHADSSKDEIEQNNCENENVPLVWYSCKQCKAMFSHNNDLSKHMKLSHCKK